MNTRSSHSIQTRNPPRSFLIGENYLTIKCAEILLKNHHTITGIVSPYSAVREWAINNQIPTFKTIDDAQPTINNEEIDYLFSIVNSRIIPNTLIEKAKKLAINYHHSPLPHYAGVNATTWAILNGERKHGVTWHAITALVDGGDVLKQAFFNIDEHETALTLNHKCNQYALQLFEELAIDLDNNNIKRLPQDLSQRSYYGLNSKPKNNGIIDWNIPAEEIECQFRALYLGMYDNSISVLKIRLQASDYIVAELKISNKVSSKHPGTLIETHPACWRISTTTYDIILLKITSLYGVECSLEELAVKHQLRVGSLINSINSLDVELFQSLSTDICKYEQFWINKLTHFEPAETPFISQYMADEESSYELIATCILEKDILDQINSIQSNKYSSEKVLLTIWLIYLYRLGNKKNLGVALSYPEINHSHQFSNLFSSEVPFFIQFTDDYSFDQAFAVVSSHFENILDKKTFLKDIFYRYQSLAGLSPFIPISVTLGETTNLEQAEFSSSSLIVLKISLSLGKLEWYINKDHPDPISHLPKIVANSATHFMTLTSAILNDRSQSISELPLLTADEKNVLLYQWNNTHIEYPRENNIGHLLAQAFQKHANKTAIQLDNSSLNYNELNDKVNRIIDYFSQNNLQPQDAIIVYMSSGLEWIVSALAIIKYGAIYVPAVANTPIKRLELMINDSKANLILTSKSLLQSLEESSSLNVPTVDVQELINNLSSNSNDTSVFNFSSDYIAYLLYTSGTTGAPKGVVIKHQSVVNLVHEQIRKLHLNSSSKVLQFASIGFDASIWEIFSTLAVGATLCIPSEQTVLIGERLAETINEFKITLTTLPPSILQTISPSQVTTLKTIVTAGESCSRELADIWVEHLCLINAYGPTETTVCATMGPIEKTGDINIGKPIANTQAYILDENLNLVPEGVVGELYIGGCPLAIGYLNKPKLTQQYFIANPFSQDETSKLYKTRDLVRWLPDGNIEYIGRIDNQIKIRGLRIEPEAIESQILHHPDITQCVVSLQHNDKMEKFIVAYYVAKRKINLHELREFLCEHLPHYMIPNFFIMMPFLPLTINGKIDRKSLPLPDWKSNMRLLDYIPPSTLIEKKLCQIWSDLLGIERIGIHNDFFTIGGNSLLLSQLIVMLRDQFNFEMHFSTILKNPTIAAIGELVSKKFNTVIDEDYDKRFLGDTILVKDIVPINKNLVSVKSTRVLLTGATGFLGVHLLKELHSNKQLTIYCLIRASSDSKANELLKRTISRYGFNFSVDERIIPLAGDISTPQLGLKEDVFNFLAKELDDIYHNGAFVHHLYSYEMLKSTNVEGTIELLRLAGKYKSKKIHYISTLSAMTQFTDSNGYIIEDFISADSITPPGNGYNQTKWVSEKLLTEAFNRGYSINIYRPGWILGNTNTGNLSSKNNHFLSLIEGCTQMHYAPNWTIEFNILPVEFLSKMIIKISLSDDFNNKVFNFSNENKISWVSIMQFLISTGYNLKVIDKKDWNHLLLKIDQDNSLFNLLPLYSGAQNDMEQNFNQSRLSQDHNVQIALNQFNESYPIINQDVLSQFLYFLKK